VSATGIDAPRTVLLAGGVGGAKMAEGLAAVLPADRLSIIGNVADDQEFHGLWVSPDIDTLTYTLAGLIDRERGWGLAGDTTNALARLAALGEPAWMTLGDQDLALHIHRTRRRAAGERASTIAADVARALSVGPAILLPTDDVVQTRVRTDEGWLSFQDYFVRLRCAPEVRALAYTGAADAKPTAEALDAIARAELIVLAPSNPLVSLAPILAIAGLRQALAGSRVPRLAVSPLIGGATVKGPADRMMTALGHEASAAGIARFYAGLIDMLAIDERDGADAEAVRAAGAEPLVLPTLMKSAEDKAALARALIAAGQARRAAA
jgi:LPPG:FO 2-phospho-L-lactate transferase